MNDAPAHRRSARGSRDSEPRLSRSSLPSPWRKDIARVLISEASIRTRVRELAKEIEEVFSGQDLAIVAVLNGTVLFLADLIRHLSFPLRLDFIGVSSYGYGTRPGRLAFTKELRMEVEGRDVLLVDDILDTGMTLSAVLAKLNGLNPRRIKVCVLLDKNARRVRPVRVDFVGFSIPDLFVVGYGLDFAERYRNLPFIGVLKPGVYRSVPGRARTPSKRAAAHAALEALPVSSIRRPGR